MFDPSLFEPAEGVEIVEDDDSTILTEDLEMIGRNASILKDSSEDREGSFGGLGKIRLKVDKKINDNLEFQGEFSIDIPKISYKADVDIGLFRKM